jgi:prepilin-type processing-associated H-X9-DG protein
MEEENQINARDNKNRIRVFFPGLNGLRFLAILLVIIGHIEQNKSWFDYNYLDTPFANIIAGTGLTFFFVLSGFLITYLFLSEKKETNTIFVRNFYIRRAFRIWPLYFLIIIVAFLIMPKIGIMEIPGLTDQIHTDFYLKFFLFLILLPNIALLYFPGIPYAAHTWAIGVMEQFYLVWPWAIKQTKRYLHLMIGFIFAILIIRATIVFLDGHVENELVFNIMTGVNRYLTQARFDSIVIGGIGAYILFYKKVNILNIIYNKFIQISVYGVLIVSMIVGLQLPYIGHEFYAVLFCIIILNVSSNPDTLVNLEIKSLSYLGKISYGLYMYHPIAIVICLLSLNQLFKSDFDSIISNIFLYFLSITLTIIMAVISYYLYEKRFLKLKNRFRNINGENDAMG